MTPSTIAAALKATVATAAPPSNPTGPNAPAAEHKVQTAALTVAIPLTPAAAARAVIDVNSASEMVSVTSKRGNVDCIKFPKELIVIAMSSIVGDS